MRLPRMATIAALVVALCARDGAGCPFCTVVGSTLAQRREEAAVVAVGERLSDDTGEASRFRIHQVLRGGERIDASQPLAVSRSGEVRPGGLALLFGASAEGDTLAWEAVPVDETSLAYAVRAPGLRQAAAERLRYFIPFLEHADPLIADDAYGEFGRAAYDVVAEVADDLPHGSLRSWLVDPAVPDERKGLYGLLLGLSTDPHERERNVAVLRQAIEKPANDFRAGFDGMLGGLLAAEGEQGLELIERRILTAPQARRGDVLHAMSALRVQAEFGRGIPLDRLARALAPLLNRQDTAAAAVVDLARWEAWDLLPRVVALVDRPEAADAGLKRAVAGYVLACPTDAAASALVRLRERMPDVIREAERGTPLLPSAR